MRNNFRNIKNKEKRIVWVRDWVKRRNSLGATNIIYKVLLLEEQLQELFLGWKQTFFSTGFVNSIKLNQRLKNKKPIWEDWFQQNWNFMSLPDSLLLVIHLPVYIYSGYYYIYSKKNFKPVIISYKRKVYLVENYGLFWFEHSTSSFFFYLG